MPSIDDALELALAAHKGQKDKGGQPYIWHPIRVAMAVEGDKAKCVALLHDAVEDGEEVSLGEVCARMQSEVANAVKALTKKPGEKYQDYILRVQDNELARVVKVADLLDNLDTSRLPNLTRKDELRCEKYRWAVMELVK